jgi:hypothetical protein
LSGVGCLPANKHTNGGLSPKPGKRLLVCGGLLGIASQPHAEKSSIL